jgi:class 3 adenylate cyclase
MTLPAFRAFLSSEALAPGLELALGRVALVFTDLAGSTALYERIGDARAFKLVGQHFGLLTAPIERHGGALVKTIGDAIMAAFPDGRSAMAAGLEMQRAIRGLETDGVVDAARLIKVGIHVGACYAVTLNERLDYFGSAVNLAARAQNEAHGGEIVATEPALEDGRPELESRGLCWQPFHVELKGFSSPVRLFRIDVAAA